MDARGLVARGGGFDHVPAEQREYLVEASVAREIRVVEVGIASVAEAVVGRDQGEAVFIAILNPVAVHVEEAGGVDVGLPLVHGELVQVEGRSTRETDRRGKAVYEYIVPLVEDGDSPNAIGET